MRGFVRLLGAQYPLLLFLIGLAAVFAGLWWIAPPWAMVVGGGTLMLLGVGATINELRTEQAEPEAAEGVTNAETP